MIGGNVKSLEGWIISVLLAALSAVLWYLLLDTRKDLSDLRTTLIANTSRIATLEIKVDTHSNDIRDLKEDVRSKK